MAGEVDALRRHRRAAHRRRPVRVLRRARRPRGRRRARRARRAGDPEALARYGREVEDAYGIELAGGSRSTRARSCSPSGRGPERYNALGDTVNVAARLQSLAADGGVVGRAGDGAPDRALRSRSSRSARSSCKGKSAPVQAFRASPSATSTGGDALAPFVGRGERARDVATRAGRALDGRGAIVSITGEPGIGKTRLVAEARRAPATACASSSAARLVRPDDPYWPVRDLLRDWLGVGVSEPEARVRLELKAALARRSAARPRRSTRSWPRLLGLSLEPEAAERLRELSRESRPAADVRGGRDASSARWPRAAAVPRLRGPALGRRSTLELVEELLALTEEGSRPRPALPERTRAPSWRPGRARAPALPAPLPRDRAAAAADSEASRELAEARPAPSCPARSPSCSPSAPAATRSSSRRRCGTSWSAARCAARTAGGSSPTAEARHPRARAGDPAGAARPARRRYARGRSASRAVIGRSFGLPLLERLRRATSLVPRCRSFSGSTSSSRSGGARRPSTASATASSRRSPTRRSRAEAARAARQRRRGARGALRRDRSRRSTACSPGTSARPTSRSAAARTCCWPATRPGPSTPTARRWSTTGARAASCAAPRRRRARARDALQDRARRTTSRSTSRAPRGPTTRRSLPRSSRTSARRRRRALELLLDPARPSRPGTRTRRETAGLDPAALPRPPADRPRPQRRPRARPEHQRLGRRADLPVHAARGRLLERRRPADRRRLRLRLARLREERPSRRSCSTTSSRPRRSTTGRSRCACASRATTSPTSSPRTGRIPWPRHAPTRSATAWRRPESLVGNGPFVLAEVDDEGARLTRQPALALGLAATSARCTSSSRARDEARSTAWLAGRYDLQLVRDAPTSPRHGRGARADALDDLPRLQRRARADGGRARAPGASPTRSTARRSCGPPGVDHAAGRGGAIPPVMPGHGDGAGMPYDPERARELLAEAGFPEGEGLPELLVARGRGRRPRRSPSSSRRSACARASRRTPSGSASRRRRTRGSRLARRLSRPRRVLPRLARAEPAALPRRGDERDPRAGARLARPRRAAAPLPRFERVWIGERAAIVPISYARQLVAAPAERAGPEAQPDGRLPPRAGRRSTRCATPDGSVADPERQRRGRRGCRGRRRPAPRAGSGRSGTPRCSSRARG